VVPGGEARDDGSALELELDDAAAYAELLAEDGGGDDGAASAAAAGNSDITALRLLLRDQETLEGALRMFV
jgi:hypothetical protein